MVFPRTIGLFTVLLIMDFQVWGEPLQPGQFEILYTNFTSPCDVNGDGKVDEKDRAILRKELSLWGGQKTELSLLKPPKSAPNLVDVNFDGAIGPEDLNELTRWLSGDGSVASSVCGKPCKPALPPQCKLTAYPSLKVTYGETVEVKIQKEGVGVATEYFIEQTDVTDRGLKKNFQVKEETVVNGSIAGPGGAMPCSAIILDTLPISCNITTDKVMVYSGEQFQASIIAPQGLVAEIAGTAFDWRSGTSRNFSKTNNGDTALSVTVRGRVRRSQDVNWTYCVPTSVDVRVEPHAASTPPMCTLATSSASQVPYGGQVNVSISKTGGGIADKFFIDGSDVSATKNKVLIITQNGTISGAVSGPNGTQNCVNSIPFSISYCKPSCHVEINPNAVSAGQSTHIIIPNDSPCGVESILIEEPLSQPPGDLVVPQSLSGDVLVKAKIISSGPGSLEQRSNTCTGNLTVGQPSMSCKVHGADSGYYGENLTLNTAVTQGQGTSFEMNIGNGWVSALQTSLQLNSLIPITVNARGHAINDGSTINCLAKSVQVNAPICTLNLSATQLSEPGMVQTTLNMSIGNALPTIEYSFNNSTWFSGSSSDQISIVQSTWLYAHLRYSNGQTFPCSPAKFISVGTSAF